jgi:hypothetical protein
MNREKLIEKIIKKKEFSDLPKKDVEMAFSKFDDKKYLDEEKIKFTRDLLRKVFSVFTSKKILSLKNKDAEWILKKHFSTRERLNYYEKVYSRIFKNFKKATVIDLGAGINGFSYDYFKKVNCDVNYVGVEAMGQLVNLMNNYFIRNKISGNAIQESLFSLNEIKKIIKKTKEPRIVFLFKVFDSLEMLERNYSKKFLLEISQFSEKIVISFAIFSLVSRRKFNAQRKWLTDFLKENFKILDDFEIGGERYIVFKK